MSSICGYDNPLILVQSRWYTHGNINVTICSLPVKNMHTGPCLNGCVMTRLKSGWNVVLLLQLHCFIVIKQWLMCSWMLFNVSGELQSISEVLFMHHVCTCMYDAGTANTTMPTAVHASTAWMWRPHEQVWFSVAWKSWVQQVPSEWFMCGWESHRRQSAVKYWSHTEKQWVVTVNYVKRMCFYSFWL